MCVYLKVTLTRTRSPQAGKTGPESLRRSAYVPYLTEHHPFEPKDEMSSTPFYHFFGAAMRKLKGGA